LFKMLGISEEPSSQGAGPMGETLWRYHLCLDLTPLSSISVDQKKKGLHGSLKQLRCNETQPR
jgi:hypothetical protein